MSDESQNPSLHREALSLLIDFTPLVGSGKSALELVTGKDYITGSHVNRWIAAGGIILGFIPFGKLLTKGKKTAKVAEEVAARIAYDAPSKAALIKKMEKVIPTKTREIDRAFILQEIKKKVKPDELKTKFGFHFDPLDSRSDMNLVQQYVVQLRYGGHAVQKHWVSGGKKDLLAHLTDAEKKKINTLEGDADDAFEYLKLILKDPHTRKLNLPSGGRIGFANDVKKVLIIHNPVKAGTFYHHDEPVKKLEQLYYEELKR